ncbi:MAG: ATP-grasp domain-containing protein [Clostridia bacterium]|nr:ATP-grasp domain-containing protein [Clostridia bacterium]
MYSSFGISKTGKKFIPLLFAGDINVYSVARAFHEAYGVKAKVYGKYATGPCFNSAIMDYSPNQKIEEEEEFLLLVKNFAEENESAIIILIGCGDSYVQLASACKGRYPENVIAPYIDLSLMDTLTNKESFYDFCSRSGIDYPDTFVHKKEMGLDFVLPFGGPFIIKPSNGVEYWRHPYETQKKVYKADTIEETEEILNEIYSAGYEDSIIIQNFIPGDDTYMRVLTSYSDRNGKVKMMCLGHVLLEEHTPHGIGNHAVIITEYEENLMKKYKDLLEGLNYVGFSNFDIKYDMRDEKYKAFEINTRQGRSNYYVTGAGANVARCFVDDYLDEIDLPLHLVKEESLWMVIPKRVAFTYIKEKAYQEKMRTLIENHRFVNPLFYDKDRNFKRMIALIKNQLGHFVKYKQYLGK